MTIDTGKELKEFVESCVSSGMYKSNSEVIREGLRMLKDKQEKMQLMKLRKLRELIKEGEQSGDSTIWDHTKFLEEMKNKYS